MTKVEDTFAIEFEEPNLLVFRSKSDESLGKDETNIQANLMKERILKIIKSKNQTSYNFLVVLGKGRHYMMSVTTINTYVQLLAECHIKKVSIVEADPGIMRLISNILNFADSYHKFNFFDDEKSAREWLKLQNIKPPSVQYFF